MIRQKLACCLNNCGHLSMNKRLVYYYCNLTTAVSVLKNRELWMTSIRNLNDSNESVAVYKLFFNLLEKYDKGKISLLRYLSMQKRLVQFRCIQHRLAHTQNILPALVRIQILLANGLLMRTMVKVLQLVLMRLNWRELQKKKG